MFECPASILRRDPTSLLAQLCEPEPSIARDPEGFFAFDRDWWLFRYIMAFMRDGTLPEDRALLAQLYREAAFWQLTELQRAIEEEKLHLRATHRGSPRAAESKGDGSSSSSSSSSSFSSSAADAKAKEEAKKWWRKIPTWQQSVQVAEQEAREKSKKKTDWWTGTTYEDKKSGAIKTYLPLPSDSSSSSPFSSSSSTSSSSSSAAPKDGQAKVLGNHTTNTWYVPEGQGRGRGMGGDMYGGGGGYSGGGYGGGGYGGGGYGGGGYGGSSGGGYGRSDRPPVTMEEVRRLTAPVTVEPLPPSAGGGILAPRGVATK